MSETARYWQTLEDGTLQCDLCPRFCRLHEGQSGLCFVRQRHGDKLVLTTYGRSSGFCIDPIEKKPLNHFLPGTPILSFGTAGCNLTCKFCQNWDMSKSREMDLLQAEAAPEQIAAAAAALECRSVAFTYNDPVIFLEYAVDIARVCRERDIKSVAVTAGYINRPARSEFFAHMDAANVDLKGFTEEFYQKHCSASLAPVLETLRYITAETDVWLELTTLLIPGQNDSADDLKRQCGWIAENLGCYVPLHFTAFHPAYRMMKLPATPFSTLQNARKIALQEGLHHVYTGNVYDPVGSGTYCHSCGRLLIGRRGYQLSEWHLTSAGNCEFCGGKCSGIFETEPGTWGSRVRRVVISDFAMPGE
ncbi:MAG: AmmeMemoRadiSam system radical SAM enzyme [FCB group bacterium]|nr:AmmeMemoRadiSam system radical SAM enzyme [FCB group bacterium]